MTRPKAGHLAMLFVINLLALTPVRAQQPHPPAEPPPPEHPAIEPAALEMLKAMSQRLAGAKSMSFTAVTTYEAPARDGQPLYYSTLSQVALQRPNKLRVITPGDGPPSDFYYDGKTMMAYSPGADLVAVADAPPTIEAAMQAAYDKAAIYFPFAEVIVGDPVQEPVRRSDIRLRRRPVACRWRHHHRHRGDRQRQRSSGDMDRRSGWAAAHGPCDLPKGSDSVAL